MNRSDWYCGRWQLIRRGYMDHPQYGLVFWKSRRDLTLDMWFRRTLWTLKRWGKS